MLAVLHLRVITVPDYRMSWLSFHLGCEIVNWVTGIRVGEDGTGAFESCYEAFFVIQVDFDYDAFGGPGFGCGRAGYVADSLAGLFDGKIGDEGALLVW